MEKKTRKTIYKRTNEAQVQRFSLSKWTAHNSSSSMTVNGMEKTHSTLTLTTIKFVLVVDKRRNHILAQFFSSALQLALFRSHCKLHRGSNLFLFCSPLTQNRMVCISHCCVCFFNLTLWHWVFCSLSLFSAYCSFNMRLEMNRNTNQCDWKIDVHWYAGEQITRSAHLIVSTKRHILSSIVYQCTYLLFVDTRRETEPNKKKCPESKILLSSHAIPCLSWFFCGASLWAFFQL